MTDPKNLTRLLIAIWLYLLVLGLVAGFVNPIPLPEPLLDYAREHGPKPDTFLEMCMLVFLASLGGLWFSRRWARALATLAILALPFIRLAYGPLVVAGPLAFLDGFRVPIAGALLALTWLSPPVSSLFARASRSGVAAGRP